MKNFEELSLGEGNTPLIPLRHLAAKWGIAEIWAKAEWCNPTGSYKDRIAVATMRFAKEHGFAGWLGTSSGNGGAAMAAYGSRAQLPGFLCVISNAPMEKLLAIRPYQVTLFLMESLNSPEMVGLCQLASEWNLKLAITAYSFNPEGMTGAEGIGKEIAAAGSFGHVYVPSGGGGLLTAVSNGFDKSEDKPRIICAQPNGCAPISRFIEGVICDPEIGMCESSISGLQLISPPDGVLAANAVRRSGGWGSTSLDEETWQAQEDLAKIEGIFVEPASALALACLRNDLISGRLASDSRAVVILTATGLKDLSPITHRFPLVREVSEISLIREVLQGRLERN